jgi:3-isopropylmalate dehydrogenase
MTRILVLPGDGIGPEITDATVEVLRHVDRTFSLGLDLVARSAGLTSLASTGTTLSDEVFRECQEADGIILGPMSISDYPPEAHGGINVSAKLRIGLDLFANIRPSRSRNGLTFYGRTPMDLVIVRENTEGFYADRSMHSGNGEFMPTADLALSVRKITASACERIASTAFELAGRRRSQVTAVHKENVLRVTEGLFLREVRKGAEAHPQVEYSEQLVDSMAALLVREADRFDVIVTTNMFGDILSDEAAERSGSLGLAASINVGDTRGMAQAQHGSAPGLAGKDVANPASLILSAAMLLDWLGRRDGDSGFVQGAETIEQAVDHVLEDPERRPRDLGGSLGTAAFARAVCDQVELPKA